MANHTTTREDGTTVSLGGAWGDQAAADEAAGVEFDPTAKSDVDTVLRDIPQIAHTPQEVVIQEPVASISVSPATDTLDLSNEETQQLTVTNDEGDDVTADCSYATADAAVATVSSTGLVTATGVGGPINITATYAGKTDTCAVTVVA